jgi:HK97 family phage prohead protease
MEYKALTVQPLEVTDERVVKSIFSVMGNIDDGNDRIYLRAFAKTLRERADRVKVLWQHDSWTPPIAVPQVLKEIKLEDLPADLVKRYPDATGALYGEVKYLETPRGDEVLQGIKSGAITENSIGYDPVRFDFEEVEGRGMVRNLHEVRLWDISPVNWGMNAATMNMKGALDAELATAVQRIKGMLARKEGRVLSAANLEKLRNALAALQEILAAAEPPDEDEKSQALTSVHGILARLAVADREASYYQMR